MQAIVETRELQAAVKRAAKLAAGKSTAMPVLQNVRITAAGDSVEVSGTDLTAWAHATVGGIIEHDDGPDSAIVNARLLANLVKLYPDDVACITIGGASVTIGGTALNVGRLEDYPEPCARIDRVHVATFEGRVLKPMVGRMKKVALNDKQTTRIALTGTYLRWADGVLTATATDGYRLLIEEYPATDAEPGDILVNTDELQRIAQLATAGDSVTLDATADALILTFADSTYSIRAMDDQFPDFARVVPDPRNALSTFSIPRRALLDAVTRGAIVADHVALAPEADSSILHVSSQSFDRGAFHENVRADRSLTPCDPVAFDAAHLLDVLKPSKADSVTVRMYSPMNAQRFTLEDDAVAGRLSQTWVVMPVQR